MDSTDANRDAVVLMETDQARMRAWAEKNADKIASFWAEDGCHFSPNMPALNGRAAVLAAFKEFFADPTFTVDAKATAVEVSTAADLAYLKGIYTARYTDPSTKKLVLEKGKYLTVYKKQRDGAWRIVINSDSSDAPPEIVFGSI
ncbi:MAG TPA: nuclear transport factor 2 family protein [Terriglobia bacterium]|nr:nuclear transport factor 2 family protein [Terriglobia bacterium]